MKIKFNFGIKSFFKKIAFKPKIHIFFAMLFMIVIASFVMLIKKDLNIKQKNLQQQLNHKSTKQKLQKNYVKIFSSVIYENDLTICCTKYNIYVNGILIKHKMIIDTLPSYFVDEYGNKIKYKYKINLDKSIEK